MKYTIDKQDRYTVFKLEEETLNSVNAPDLKAELVVLANEGVANLIMDLSAVTFVDSSGLSAILTAHRIWKKLGSFILTGIDHPNVKKLIAISRLNDIFEIVPTVSEGIDYAMMSELEREINQEAEDQTAKEG